MMRSNSVATGAMIWCFVWEVGRWKDECIEGIAAKKEEEKRRDRMGGARKRERMQMVWPFVGRVFCRKV